MSGTTCLDCGGFKGEPGKAYGYAGKWCHCALYKPENQRYVPASPSILSDNLLSEILERLEKLEKLINRRSPELPIFIERLLGTEKFIPALMRWLKDNR